jgi:hypothetical protein
MLSVAFHLFLCYLVMLNVITPNVILLSAAMLNVMMLSVVMLSVIMLSVIVLSVDILNVVAPHPHKKLTWLKKLPHRSIRRTVTHRPNKLECYITTVCKYLPRTNTLAYSAHLRITEKSKCCEYSCNDEQKGLISLALLEEAGKTCLWQTL